MGVFAKMFGKYLLVTNTVSCGLMMGAGDVMQQRSDFLKKHILKTATDQPTTTTTTATTTKSEETGKKPAACAEDPEGLVRIVSKSEVASETSGFDYVRARNMMAVGLVQGPFSHYFYDVLERVLPGKSAATLFKKTLLDQSIASPTCLGIFFFGLGVLEKKDLQDINGEVKLKWFDTWKVDCMFWPPAQFINFLFVPVRYRVIYTNFMTMIYDIFLSYMKYDAEH